MGHNITSAITALQKLRIGDTITNLEENGINVLHIDVMDSGDNNIQKHFESSFKFIESALKKGNVLVHCLVGISRSATLVIAYLMKKRKKGWVEMWDYVKKRRPYCEPNEGFKVQ